MADNLSVTAGSGTTIAADDIGGGVLVQRVKPAIGADGTAVDVSAGAGAVGTGVQRMTLASDDPAVASLSVLDDWDESDRAKVNLIVGQAGIAAGAGASGATVPRVTLASDSPGIITTGTAGSASAVVLTVQGVASMTPLLVTPSSVALPANQSVNLAQVGGTNSVNGGLAGSQSVGGTVATNVAITDNPVNIGGQAVSSENAAVTTARKVQAVFDLVGKQIVLPYANPENFVSGTTSAMTGTTSTSLIAAPASGLRNYITQITVSNAHATVGTDVIIQDGSGGTTLYTIPAAAVYGGAVITFPTPLRQPTTATALFCANVTTGASTKASASGYKGA